MDAVRRLAATMDEVSKDVNGFDTPMIAAGMKPIPEELLHKIVEARKVSKLNDSKTLFIPSPYVMWFQRASYDKHDRPVYLTSFCRTKAQACERLFPLVSRFLKNENRKNKRAKGFPTRFAISQTM